MKDENAFLEIMKHAEDAEMRRGKAERKGIIELKFAYGMQKDAFLRSLFIVWLYDEETKLAYNKMILAEIK